MSPLIPAPRLLSSYNNGMARAEIPVVLKLLGEADASVDQAVKQARQSLDQAGKQSLGALAQSAENAALSMTTKISKAFTEARINFSADKVVSGADVGLSNITRSTQLINSEIDKISTRFASAVKSQSDLASVKSLDKLTESAERLLLINQNIALSYQKQKAAAEAFRKSSPDDLLKNKDALERSKVLTQNLQKEAASIRQEYAKVIADVSKELKVLEKPIKLKVEKQIDTSSLEIALLNSRAASSERLRQNEYRLKEIAQQRLDLESKIKDIKNDQVRSSVAQKLASTDSIKAQQDSVFRQIRAEQARLQSLLRQQITAVSQGKSGDPFKTLIANSNNAIKALEADAKRLESTYQKAFSKINTEAGKILRGQGSGGGGFGRSGGGGGFGRSSSAGSIVGGLGIFSPFVNQIGSFADSIIGQVAQSASQIRTTVGIQFGQALAQGIGQGFNKSADLLGVETLSKEFAKLDVVQRQLVANLTTGLVVGFAAVGAALSAISLATVKVASDFEVLTSKLTTSFKSPERALERFGEALDLAAKTPYDVKQVVEAQVLLSSLGDKNLETLRRTVDLASGLNVDLARTSIEVGKAAAGSYRGYQELRNTLGITTDRLKQFGAITDSTNRLLLQNEYQIRRNREALFKLIDTDFGGSAERLSQTLQGRISNLQDEILKLGGALGNVWLPAAKGSVDVLRGLVELLNSTPSFLKVFASGVIATGAATSGLVVSLSAVSLGLGVMGSAVAALSGPAFAGLVGSVTGLSTALGVLNFTLNQSVVKSLPLLGSSLASAIPALTLLGLAVGAANTYLVAQIEKSEAAGRAIKAYTVEIAEAKRANVLFQETLNNLSVPQNFLDGADTLEEKIKRIQEVIRSKGALSVAQDLNASGISLDQINEAYQKQNKTLEQQQDRLKLIRKLQDEIALKQIENAQQANAPLDTPLTPAYLAQVVKEFEDLNPAAAAFTNLLLQSKNNSTEATAALDKYASIAQKIIRETTPIATANKEIADSFAKLQEAIDKVSKPLKQAEAFAKFANKVDDIAVVNEALVKQQELLSGITREIEKAGIRPSSAKGGFSVAEATRLLGGATDANKILLESYIKTNDTITELTNKRIKIEESNNKYRLQLIQANEKAELSILNKSALEKQKVIIQQAIALAQPRAEQYRKDLIEFNKNLDALSKVENDGDRQRIQNYLDRNKEKIDAEKRSFDFLIEQRKKLSQIMNQIEEAEAKEIRKNNKATVQEQRKNFNQEQRKNFKILKDDLQNFLEEAKSIAGGVRPKTPYGKSFIGIDGQELVSLNTSFTKFWKSRADEPLSAAEKIEVFKQKLVELSSIETSVDLKIFSPEKQAEIKNKFQDIRRELEDSLSKAELAAPKEQFQKFKSDLESSLSETVSKTRQLEIFEQALVDLRRQYVKGNLTTIDYKKEQAVLQKRILDLQTDINQETSKQRAELEKINAERAKDELEILKIRKNRGEKNPFLDFSIKEGEINAVNTQLAEIRRERDLEIQQAEKTGSDIQLIRQKYAAKELGVVRQGYMDYIKAEDDKYKATEDRIKKTEDRLKQFRDSRLGGANSPLMSVEEMSFRSSLSGFGSDFDTGLDLSRASNRLGFGQGFGKSQKLKLPDFDVYKSKFETDNRTGPIKYIQDPDIARASVAGAALNQAATGDQYTIYINGSLENNTSLVKSAANLAQAAADVAGKKSELLSGDQGEKQSKFKGLNLNTSLNFGTLEFF